MPEVIRFAKGTASEHLNFTGENGEITLICDDTPNRKVTGVIRLHDGQTVGGIPFGGSQLLNDLHDVNAANTIEFQVMTVDANGQFYFANTIQTEKLDVNGEITQPINAFIGSNIYYDEGWKYRGNGTGGILKLADGEGIVFSTTAYNVYGEGAAATPSEHMRINISGNVGIGTDNPQARLHISSETSGTVVTLSNQFGFSQFRQAANTLSISNADTLGSIVFETNNGAQRMRIDSSGALICLGSAVFNENGYVNDFRIESDTNTHAFYLDGATGNIGIGTSSPSYNIDVKGSAGISAQRATDTDRLIMQWDGLTSYGNSVGAYNNIKFISQNNSGSVERMRIDSSGRVTIPYQPSFRVGSGSAIENTTSSAITMIFTTVAHNTGGHFNTTNGTFTAPVAGSYQFNFSGNVKETTSTPSNFWVELRINGSRKAIWYTNNDSDLTWQLISGSLVIYLQANDAVDLRQSQYTWFDSSMWTQFSGHLLG